MFVKRVILKQNIVCTYARPKRVVIVTCFPVVSDLQICQATHELPEQLPITWPNFVKLYVTVLEIAPLKLLLANLSLD
jgi:hypothetical protein